MHYIRIILVLMSVCLAVQGLAQIKKTKAPAPAAPKTAKPAPSHTGGSESVTPGPNRLVLKIMTDARCTIYVDGESRGIAEPGVAKKIGFAPGEYLLKCESVERMAVSYEEVLAYEKSEMGVEKVLIVELAEQLEQLKYDEQEEMLLEQAAAAAMQALQGDMLLVEGGSFEMGCDSEQRDCHDDEKPLHRVEISSFYMGKYEVTQAQWLAVMGSNPSHFAGCAQCPVESVSWDDVQVFLQKLNAQTGQPYRLPTEAEWEYAARGGSKSRQTQYAGGNNLDEISWHYHNSGDQWLSGEYDDEKQKQNHCKTHPVGQKKANELGLFDMSGNVWEWCSDWYDANYYTSSPGRDPMGPGNGEWKTSRGGSWRYNPLACRVAKRNADQPALRFINLGFRLVLPYR